MNDPYLDTENCIQRLFEQWKLHPKLIVALDFDETIFDFHNKGYQFPEVVELIKECQELGFYIIIFTASAKTRHPFILEHCQKLGIFPHKINENAFPSEFGNEGKVFYNILLDDRAGLGQSVEILRAVITSIKYELGKL